MPKKKPRLFRRLSYIAQAVVKSDFRRSPVEAHVINIGYGGMAIYVRGRLEGQIDITIFHEDENGKTVAETLLGNAAWNKALGSMTACGIEFGNLNPQDHGYTMSIIEEFIK